MNSMQTCKFCGTGMSDSDTFCSSCGKKSITYTNSHSVINGSQAEAPAASDAGDTQRLDPTNHSTIPLSTSPTPTDADHPTGPLSTGQKAYHTVPIHVIEKEDEEERRRRIAMLDPEFASPDEQPSNSALPVSPLADITTHENVALVPESPFPDNVPQMQGMPPSGGNLVGQPWNYAPVVPQTGMGQNTGSIPPSPYLPPAALPMTPLPPSMPLTPPAYSSSSQAFTQSRNSAKWLRIGLITGLVLVILLLSGMGLSLLASAPYLTLSEGTTVAPGSTIHLHGNHFIPHSTVTLILDQTTPLSSTSHRIKRTIASNYTNITGMWISGNRLSQTPLSENAIKVGADGTFSANIQVGMNWALGAHTIQATDPTNDRSATLSFTIMQQTPVFTQGTMTPETITPTPTVPSVAPATPLPIPTPVITPTVPATASLNGVTPGILTLGPASEGGQQAVTSAVALNTTGTALLTWKAIWDQQQLPWLQLTPTSGRIQAPASQKITISASSANLKAGTYKALITFISSPNARTVELNIVLTVQAGCIKVAPTSLTFVSTVGSADPASQTVTLSNCGMAGTWSATTSANSSWLSVKPTSFSLKENGTQAVTVAVAAASQKLTAGTYQGQILLSNGSSQTTVPVTLTIQSPAQLNISQAKIAVAQACQNSAGTWTCSETLSNSSTQGTLAWTASSNGTTGVTLTPASGTIAAGQTTVVSIAIPVASCASNFTLTFTGPANTVNVPVDCGGTQPAT